MRTVEITAAIENRNSLSKQGLRRLGAGDRAIPNKQYVPLIDWRGAVVRQAPSHAGRFIARRYRLQPHLAEAIASLAGLVDVEARR